MKKLIKHLGIFTVIVGIVFFLVGCNMSGYKVHWFEINSSIYADRPSNATAEEHLQYIDGSTSQNNVYFTSDEEGLREFFTEKCGYLSKLDKVIQQITEEKVSYFYYVPGLLAVVDKYYFFYVENNNL